MIRRVDDTTELLLRLSRHLADRGLSSRMAAARIGIAQQTLQSHLEGRRRPRAGTILRYRSWIDSTGSEPAISCERRPVPPKPHVAPGASRHVVDLFSGCGGLSLGFEMLDGGRAFDCVLALDIDRPMVDVFNANRPGGPSVARPVARCVDLEDFLNEAEVLAFYLDQLAVVREDTALLRNLNALPHGGMQAFKGDIAALDAAFESGLRGMRDRPDYHSAVEAAAPGTWTQTSVQAFHVRLRLPLAGLRWLPIPLIWGEQGSADRTPIHTYDPSPPPKAISRHIEDQWSREVARLDGRVQAQGERSTLGARGKIAGFLKILDAEPIRRVRAFWGKWASARLALRRRLFEDDRTGALLRHAYTESRRVSVILGGPPCQGFSRAGRGKLRSLREQGAHVQAHADVGDERNLLLHKYVLFVKALEPDVFLFENVSTFRSKIHTGDGVFDAVQALQNAFKEVSTHGVHYEMESRDVECSRHGIPQNRRRFFMAGVRCGSARATEGKRLAASCLDLPLCPPVPLSAALAGLRDARQATSLRSSGLLSQSVSVERPPAIGSGARRRYARWIGLDLDGQPRGRRYKVDAHVTRAVRRDDRAWFRRMGPGQRWMDYRCDRAPTKDALRVVLGRLLSLLDSTASATRLPSSVREQLSGLSRVDVMKLLEAVDGSLSIRLLLEGVAPPTQCDPGHHLLRPVYLSKRSGEHGDWLRRLDGRRPCRTLVSHMAKDTYQYVHPSEARMLSVREAARIQSFPDAFSFAGVGIFHAFKMIGNAVPPLLSSQLANRIRGALPAVAMLEGKQGAAPRAPVTAGP